jgi:uncharacterized protein YecE (DUF72 family)
VSQLDLFGSEAEIPREDDPWAALCQPPPPGLLMGSCAWNHHSFDLHFYPKGLPKNRQLAWYARHFNAVEVDSTFYRTPARSTVERWVGETPDHFRFSIKAPRAVTHEGGLDLGVAQVRFEWENFCHLLPLFGHKLANVLVQLGPNSTAFQLPLLAALVEAAPPGTPIAVELRHPTWNSAEVEAWLTRSGVVRAWVDSYNDPARGVTESTPGLHPESGRFRYIRLLGNVSTKYNPDRPTGRNFDYGTVLFDRRDDLAKWVDRTKRSLQRGMPVHLFINNHYQGFTPITALEIQSALRE